MTASTEQFPKTEIDAKTFQHKLEELATTMAYKVQREGESKGLKPDVVAMDIYFTLSRYIDDTRHGFSTKHQNFLKTLTLGFWKEYSGISHATFNGPLPTALFLSPRDLPHEQRPNVDLASDGMISLHIARVAAILLSILTEVQAWCSFDGARINQRLHELRNTLIVIPEIKELYDERYSRLMKEKGINPE